MDTIWVLRAVMRYQVLNTRGFIPTVFAIKVCHNVYPYYGNLRMAFRTECFILYIISGGGGGSVNTFRDFF